MLRAIPLRVRVASIGVIRRATDADVSALLPLIEAFCRADGHPYDGQSVLAALQPLLGDARLGRVLLAEHAGRAVGYAVLTWGWSLESGGREALLDEIFAAEPGRGTGSALLAAAVREAREADARALFLETETGNSRARAFYAGHGFATEDSVWMRLPLPGGDQPAPRPG
jgi:GNAT superfamily N-acetyltransferase